MLVSDYRFLEALFTVFLCAGLLATRYDVRPFSYIAMLSGASLSQPNIEWTRLPVSPFCWKPVASSRR